MNEQIEKLTPSEAVREMGLTHIIAEDIKGKEYLGIRESVKRLHSKGKILREDYEKYISLVQSSYFI